MLRNIVSFVEYDLHRHPECPWHGFDVPFSLVTGPLGHIVKGASWIGLTLR